MVTLPDDCINIIKSFAGITSLDIVNCYRELRKSSNPKINERLGHIYVKKVSYLLELLPYLVKKSKKIIDYSIKSHINQHAYTWIDRSEIIVAMKLLGYPMLDSGFQAEFISDTQVTRKLKKIFKFKMPAYKLECNCFLYKPLLTYLVFKNIPCNKFDKIIDNKNKCLKILNYEFV